MLYAQAIEPFSTIRIQAGPSFNIDNNIIHNYWDSSIGAEFIIEMPFYFGYTQAGILLTKYKGKTGSYPDFSGNMIYAGLGSNVMLPLGMDLYGGFKLGYFLMDYDEATLSKYAKSESEFAAGVNLRLSKMIIKNFYLSASYDLSFLFTHKRIRFYFLSAGAAYNFNTPLWLRDFFK